MDYAAAEHYLLATINETISRRLPYKLERMRAFLRELGDPHERYPTVHIGGTSGKGSTSTIVAAVLAQRGLRTGLHTKPHLRSMTERARIDGNPVAEERFAELLTEMMPAIERTAMEHGRPTYYETLLALAFEHFARERVDVGVIEVGLGGRLDGTNVITPAVAAITSIGFDHMDVLGDTLELIAAEKAGIAKPGVPIVVAIDDPAAFDVVAAQARLVGAPLVRVAEAARIENVRILRDAQAFDAVTAGATYRISTSMLGEFQRRNVLTAIAAMERLPEALRPEPADVEAALSSLRIPGRMEVFAGHPTVVFDIAHNAEKAEHLAASLRESFPGRHVRYVVAIGESKDAREILRALHTVPSSFVFTRFETEGRHPIKPQRLASIAESLGTWGRSVLDPVEALTIARRGASNDDIVVVTGSTFIVAELREWWMASVAA
jgi:dihydrofolate synthase/folylpolyglutamate synthase